MSRLAVVIGAIVIAVGAYLVLKPGDDGDKGGTTTARTETGAKRTQPAIPALHSGKVTEIKVKQGDRVAFTARSDKAEEVHVHGYDILKNVPAGGTVRFSFKATTTGIFVIELEHAAEQIGKLVVEP